MMPFRHVCAAVLASLSMLPAAGGAAVSDWYGTWQTSYAGDDTGTCTVNITAGNATQAGVSVSCRSSIDGSTLSGSGSMTATGSLGFTGSAAGIDVNFSGVIQGSSGSGQWTDTIFGARGTWTITRTSPPQPVATNPDQQVAPPPTVQTAYTVPSGRMPTAAVTATASGTLGRASLFVALDLSKVLSGGAFAGLGQFAAGYNIYVVALVPAGALGLPSATWFQLPATRAWGAFTSPIAAYLEGVAQAAASQIVPVSILQDLDVTALLGTEIYAGYGTSDAEMLANGRYRGVYIVR